MSFDNTPFRQDFGMLVEGGFIAVKQGNRDAAEKLFRAAQVLNPSHTAPLLGFGYIALNAMNLQLARRYFEDVIAKEPQNPQAKVLLGFCFILTKINYKKTRYNAVKPEEIDALANHGAGLINEALKHKNIDSGIKRLGESALELLKKVDNYQETPLKSQQK